LLGLSFIPDPFSFFCQKQTGSYTTLCIMAAELQYAIFILTKTYKF